MAVAPKILDISKYDIDSDAFTLKNSMDKILQTVVSIYDSYNMPLPTRRYWTFGSPVSDCEQLVVSFVQMYLGAPGDEASVPRRCTDPRSVVVTISITRAVAVLNNSTSNPIPAADKIQSAAEVQALDSWILMESMDQFDKWGEYDIPGLGVIATVDTSEAQGGLRSTRMQLTLAVS